MTFFFFLVFFYLFNQSYFTAILQKTWFLIPLHQLIVFQFSSHSNYDSDQMWFSYFLLMWTCMAWKRFDYGRTVYSCLAKFCHQERMAETKVSLQTIEVCKEIWEPQPKCGPNCEAGSSQPAWCLNACLVAKIYQTFNMPVRTGMNMTKDGPMWDSRSCPPKQKVSAEKFSSLCTSSGKLGKDLFWREISTSASGGRPPLER